jgi:drug/metabolite transporter (DMT)-like permease
VVTGGALHFDLSSSPGYGYAAIAALIWASYSLLIKRFQPLPDSLVSGFCLLAGLLALGLFWFSSPSSQTWTLTRQEWLYVILIGIGPHGIAFVTWNLALNMATPRDRFFFVPIPLSTPSCITGTAVKPAVAG